MLGPRVFRASPVSDPSGSCQKRKKLLDQHRLAWTGTLPVLYGLDRTIGLATVLPFFLFPRIRLLFILYASLLQTAHLTGRSKTYTPSLNCGHFDEEYVSALKGTFWALLLLDALLMFSLSINVICALLSLASSPTASVLLLIFSK